MFTRFLSRVQAARVTTYGKVRVPSRSPVQVQVRQILNQAGQLSLPLKDLRHFSQSTHEKVDEVMECFRKEKYALALDLLDGVLKTDEKNYLALYQKGEDNFMCLTEKELH